MRASSGLNEDSQQLSKPAEVVARWFYHFSGVASQLSQEFVYRFGGVHRFRSPT